MIQTESSWKLGPINENGLPTQRGLSGETSFPARNSVYSIRPKLFYGSNFTNFGANLSRNKLKFQKNVKKVLYGKDDSKQLLL